MLVRKLLVVAAVIGILTIAGRTFAEDESREATAARGTYSQDEPQEPKKPTSFVERLDAFRNKVVSGILPSKKKPAKPSEAAQPSETRPNPESAKKDTRVVSRKEMLPDAAGGEPAAPRAGSILEKPKSGPAVHDDPTLTMDQFLSNRKPPTARPKTLETPRVETPERSPRSLQERMAAFRRSPFDDDQHAASTPVSEPRQQSADVPVQKEKGDSNLDIDSPYPENQPVPARRTGPAERVGTARPAEPIHEADDDQTIAVDAQTKPGGDPLPPEPVHDAKSDRTAAVDARPKPADDPPMLEPIYEADSSRTAAVDARPKSLADPRVPENPASAGTLFVRKGPQLSVETTGPRTIVVGREASYQVQITNSGDVAADDLVVHVTLPAWAEVARIEASMGEAKPPEAAPAGAIDWRVGHLDAKSQQRLTVRIIPRQSRPLDLAVRWESKPVASQTMIEVQEPKLSLQLEGPHEVAYGKKEIYRLKLANKGSGNAENVTIIMTPIGTGENLPASHKIGLLAAGEEKVLDVELTAREGGLLSIQAEARGDGGLHAELLEKVLVRRAGLKADITGPKVQFVGAVANYVIRVRNSGNAAARNVRFSVALPAGATYLSGVDGARFDTAENRLVWGVDALPTEAERRFAIKCRLATVGATPVRLSVAADDDVTAIAETNVHVETVATLTMDVKDPASPMPVGEDAVYEVCVRNRGTREAQSVEVFAYFSRGIEPTAAEGAPSRLVPGEVVFQPIASLAPGAEAVLRVHAKADIPGNHVIRVEARCRQLNARLISEATNLYYSDAPAASQPPQSPAATNAPPTDDRVGGTPPLPIRGNVTPLLPRE
jgi:uncharacterized repeat protein (TIGR01451 family)